MTSTITRVGIVAKRGLAAADHLNRLAAWLRERSIDALFETETAALAGAGAGARAKSREELPRDVDLVIVMGGDGTLLSMATRIALCGRDIPILGVNFGSLGFLTEIRIDELYPALESVIAGTATLDQRADEIEALIEQLHGASRRRDDSEDPSVASPGDDRSLRQGRPGDRRMSTGAG